MSSNVLDKSIKALSKKNEGSVSQMLNKAFAGEEIVAKYRTRWNELKDIREPMETKWKQIRDYLDPAASRWLDTEDDDDDPEIDDSQILDSTPRKMAQTAADGLHGGLSNPAAQWFSFYIGDYADFDTEISKQAKIWLEMAQECVRDTLANTNYYTSLHSLYKEMLEFGCSLMMMYSDPDRVVKCHNYTIGSFWVAQNNTREVDSVYIKSRQSARDLVDVYGEDRCPDKVIDAINDKRPDARFTVIQCIQPFNFFGDLKASSGFEYEDVRFVAEGSETDPLLFRGGYKTKPFIFARWSESGDFVYPRTFPGIDALPDIKHLYTATEDYRLALSWVTNPAFLYDSALETEIDKLKPGGLIQITNAQAKNPVQAVIPPVFDIDRNIQYRQTLIDKISGIFYNREIMMITARAEQNHVMTATEVSLLQQEKNAVLGPITNRTANDILKPSLDRAFEIIQLEWHILDEAPEELYGKEIKPYFTSDLAVTQRQAWVNRANEVLEWLLRVGQADSTVFDSFDLDTWAREFERTDVLPAHFLKSRQEVEELRQARAQQIQEQQRAEAMDNASKVAQRLGGTPTTGDNAAAELLAQSGGMEGETGGE